MKVSQKALGLEGHKLQTNIATRWNSKYKMVDRFFGAAACLISSLVTPGLRKNNTADTSTLSDAEIKHAEEITMALRPMRDTTNIMSECYRAQV